LNRIEEIIIDNIRKKIVIAEEKKKSTDISRFITSIFDIIDTLPERIRLLIKRDIESYKERMENK
jgi:hypothetical protein